MTTRQHRFAAAHPILWLIVRSWQKVGDGALVQTAEAEEKANGLSTFDFTVPDPPINGSTRPTQLVPYSKVRRKVGIVNTGLTDLVLLTAATDKIANGFTVRPGKITLKCKAAIWATVPAGTASATVTVIETFDKKLS